MTGTKIAYGIFNQRDRIKNTSMYTRFKGASLFYLERQRRNLDIICGDEIHEILRTALAQGYDYCVMLSAGCMIKDFNFDLTVRKFISENHFGVAGHPLYHPGRWLELHAQFFIVNLQAYYAVDEPEFGEYEFTEQMLPVIQRSEENFHHDYTPLWVKPTGKHAMQNFAGQGWKLLAAMFDNEWPVITLPENIRFNKFYAYPEHETTQFEQAIKSLTTYENQNWNQSKLITDAALVKDQIWLFNSEDLQIHNPQQFDLAVNTASGFKILDLYKTPRLKKNAKILVYDFNPIALSWYQHFHSYSGFDLIQCIRDFAQKDNFTWIGHHDSKYSEDWAFHDHVRKTYEYFNGEDQFIGYWHAFKNTQVEFVQCDLYQQPEKFAELFQGKGTKFVNLSNIFSTDATTLYYGHTEVIARQARLLALLYVTDPEIQVNIHDHWNRHKIGKIKDIL